MQIHVTLAFFNILTSKWIIFVFNTKSFDMIMLINYIKTWRVWCCLIWSILYWRRIQYYWILWRSWRFRIPCYKIASKLLVCGVVRFLVKIYICGHHSLGYGDRAEFQYLQTDTRVPKDKKNRLGKRFR